MILLHQKAVEEIDTGYREYDEAKIFRESV